MLGKLFTDTCIDESLQYLLPDIPPASWYGEDTYDEDGELHSFNDVPIIVKKAWNFRDEVSESLNNEDGYALQENVEFRWYSHGKISRANNLPPFIAITPNSYLTLDETGRLHSYNGMPAAVEVDASARELRASWYSNNFLSRDDSLPAVLSYSLDGSLKGESFYVNRISHRGGGMPSLVNHKTKTWKVQGVLHNANGAAESYSAYKAAVILLPTWSLYGVSMAESFFDSVKKLETDNGIPLYAAFLVSMKITTLECLETFTDDAGVWKADVPVPWVIRALNVTPEIFSEKILEAQAANFSLGVAWHRASSGLLFQKFMLVIASEDTDAAAPVLT